MYAAIMINRSGSATNAPIAHYARKDVKSMTKRQGRWVYSPATLEASYIAWFRSSPDPSVWLPVESPLSVYSIMLPDRSRRIIVSTSDDVRRYIAIGAIDMWELIFDPASHRTSEDEEVRYRSCLTAINDPHSCVKCGAPVPCEYHS